MKDEILSKAYTLKEALEKSDNVTKLKQAELLMEKDDEVMVLSYHFSCAQMEYNDVLKHFDKNSEQAIKVQKKLYETKKKLDEHTLVKNYLMAYQKVRQDYELIQKEIFAPFNMHECNEKK